MDFTLDEKMIISIYLKRDLHDNGMSITEYADAVIAGTMSPLSHDEYVYQFGAVEDEVNLVIEWATNNGLEVVESSIGMAVVKVMGAIRQFDSLFSIRLMSVSDGERTYITHNGKITIPSDIDNVVEQVLGLDNSEQLTRRSLSMEIHAQGGEATSMDPTPAPPGYGSKTWVTPMKMATAYQLPPGDGFGQTIAIVEFQGSGWNQTDVNNSFSYGGLSPVPTITNYLVDGATASTTSDGETMMDIWCSGAVCPRAKIVVYYAPNNGTGFMNMLLAIANDTVNNPSVVSISWGYPSEAYADYLNTAFAACVVKNILVFISSGDEGGNDQVAQYPSTNAYVISAGGTTTWLNANNSLNAERVWSGTGGGISTVIARPSWQASPPIYYTPYTYAGNVVGSSSQVTMRGVPDLSAPADPYTGYRFYVNSGLIQNGGTSAAAPFLAGFFARLNGLLRRRIQFGELMSLLYSNSGVTNDITLGTNTFDWNANSGAGKTVNGYIATTGWDACTGLGSPIGTAIYKLLHTGETYPKLNHGFRAATGAVYPRTISGTRNATASYFIPFNSTTTTASATNAKLGGRTDYTGSANTNSGVSVAWTIGASSVSVTATGIPFHSYYNSAAANIPAIQNYSKTWTYRGGTNVAGTQPGTGGGKIGLWLNGISMFNPSAQGGSPGMGYATYTNWHYNAAYEAGVELGYGFGEDDAGAHAAPPNEYHYHDGSMIVSGAWTTGVGHTSGTYGNGGIAECSVIPYLIGGLTHPDGHSKIMGICADGYPVYGPYGYATATNANSGVRRMVSGYTVNNTRTPNGTTPTVNATYPLGMFVEDWTFTGGSDLDTHNGRYCVTPEYPNGTYAYFLAFNASMKPTYPYVIGNTYYGTPAVL